MEDRFRRNLYLATKTRVATHNELFNNGYASEPMQIDIFADYTQDELFSLRSIIDEGQDEWNDFKVRKISNKINNMYKVEVNNPYFIYSWNMAKSTITSKTDSARLSTSLVRPPLKIIIDFLNMDFLHMDKQSTVSQTVSMMNIHPDSLQNT